MVGGKSAAAECEILSTRFTTPHTFGYDHNGVSVPFYEGYGKPSSTKVVSVVTNNDPSCEGRSVFLTIFAAYKQIDPQLGAASPDKPLANISNKEYKLFKVGGLDGEVPQYTLGASFYTAEESCVGYGETLLKKMVDEAIAAGTKTKQDFEYLNSGTTKVLYDYLFNGGSASALASVNPLALAENVVNPLSSSTLINVNTDAQWAIKKVIYKEFGKALDCGYYARARLDTKMEPMSVVDEKGKPFAKLTPADQNAETLNFVGYMCNLEGVVLCDATQNWNIKNAFETTPGGIDLNDKCSKDGNIIPGCYELLAPIPGLGETINFDKVGDKEPFALEQFFTAGINIVIGAVSIMAVLALMYYGFAMMRDRSRGNVSGIKIDKQRIIQVFYGIGIILGSYVILNTINPELLVIAPNLDPVTLQSFDFSSELYGTDTGGTFKGKLDLNKDLCPVVTKISQSTGVDKFFLLAVLQQESGGGRNVGTCYMTNPADGSGKTIKGQSIPYVMMAGRDVQPFIALMSTLGKPYATRTVSCPIKDNSARGYYGFGGGMGIAQFIPSTWAQYAPKVKQATGKPVADPWDMSTAMHAQGFFFKDLLQRFNGDEVRAANGYYGSQAASYGREVAQKKAAYKKMNACDPATVTAAGSSSSSTTDKSVLFIGDSITESPSSHAYKFKSSRSGWNVTISAHQGEKTSWMLQQLQGYQNAGKKYGAIVVLGGTNDVYATGSSSGAISSLGSIITAASTMTSKLVLIAPPTDQYYSSNTPTKTAEIIKIRDYMAAQSGRAYFVDFYNMTKDKGAGQFSDGLHPKSATYDQVLSSLNGIIN